VLPKPSTPYLGLAALFAGFGMFVCLSNLLTILLDVLAAGAADNILLVAEIGVNFTAAVIGGIASASVAKHSNFRHALFAGVMTTLLLPFNVTILDFILDGHRLDAAYKAGAWLPLLTEAVQIYCSYVIALLYLPAGSALGGLIDRRLTAWSARLHPRGRWTYTTSRGRMITALAPQRHPEIARLWYAFGGIMLIASPAPLIWHLTRPIRMMPNPRGTVSVIFHLIVMGLVCIIIGNKRSALSVREALEKDPRRPVLYLRSFGHEGRKLWEGAIYELVNTISALLVRTIEQRLAAGFRAIGPLIAIGRPEDELPEVGAARMYVGDLDWQDVVLDLLPKCSAILVQGGETPGLLWELSVVASKVPPERVILLMPFARRLGTNHREAAYTGFLNWASSCMPCRLPDRIGDTYFLYFTSGWKCHCLGRARDVPREQPLRDALMRFAKDPTFQKQPRFDVLRVIAWTFPALAIIIFALIYSILDFFGISL
jgi:hypothetical protein